MVFKTMTGDSQGARFSTKYYIFYISVLYLCSISANLGYSPNNTFPWIKYY